MSYTIYPPQFLKVNAQSSKQLNVVLQIEGLTDTLSVVPTYEKLRYGDVRLKYGLEGLVYGGLILKEGVRSYISLDSGMTIGQKVEPEQGRCSVSTLSFQFIDKDQYITKLISPGVMLADPLGGPLCTVWVGYANTSFPDDYFPVFRGFMTDTTSQTGKVIIQLSDANLRRRANLFEVGTTSLSSDITGISVYIPVGSTAGLYKPILGPNGTYDSSVTPYIQIDNEVIQYGPGGLAPTQVTALARGARGTVADVHASLASVSNNVYLQGNPIDLMLKLMLSGWNGPWITGLPVVALGTTIEAGSTVRNVILTNFDNDVIYGITPGDYVTVTGSLSNDGTYVVNELQDTLDGKNRALIINTNLVIENPSLGTISFRSKYDTLPVEMGLQGTPQDVDVASHEKIKRIFFSTATSEFAFYITQPEDGKSFIEKELCLPLGIYSITRYGRISLAATKPPIADDKLIILDSLNIIDPQTISIKRALNNRRFYNVVTLSYDVDDAGSFFASVLDQVDSTSLTQTKTASTLPIQSKGIRTVLGSNLIAAKRAKFLLNRYKRAAYEITFKVNWSIGSQIEVGDTVILNDNGTLQITNFETGARNMESQIFEVIQRQMNLKDGNVTLTILSSLGYKIGDRYATIAPSSVIGIGSSTTTVVITDSFGVLYPGDEQKKWTAVIGNQIRVHNYDYSVSEVTTLTGFSSANPYEMQVNPPLSFSPTAGMIVDLAPYDTGGTNQKNNLMSKLLYTFYDRSISVVSGIDDKNFTVSSSDSAYFVPGYYLLVHSSNYSNLSVLAKIVTVSGVQITVDQTLGFTPSPGDMVEGLNMIDGNGSYKVL